MDKIYHDKYREESSYSLFYDNNMCEATKKWAWIIWVAWYIKRRSWRRDEMEIIKVKQKKERKKEKSVGYRVMISTSWERKNINTRLR